eukprot:6658099-Pyramimonas_sp.AAC.1
MVTPVAVSSNAPMPARAFKESTSPSEMPSRSFAKVSPVLKPSRAIWGCRLPRFLSATERHAVESL